MRLPLLTMNTDLAILAQDFQTLNVQDKQDMQQPQSLLTNNQDEYAELGSKIFQDEPMTP